MTARRKLDAQRDYETTAGNFENDPGYTSQVIFLLTLVKGTLPFYPDKGNGFLTRGGGLVSSSPRLAEREAVLALRPLTASGKISKLSVAAEVVSGGRVSYIVSFYDRSTSTRRQLTARVGT